MLLSFAASRLIASYLLLTPLPEILAQEIDLGTKKVDNVLAARDPEKHRQQLALEHMKCLTEQLERDNQDMADDNTRLEQENGKQDAAGELRSYAQVRIL